MQDFAWEWNGSSVSVSLAGQKSAKYVLPVFEDEERQQLRLKIAEAVSIWECLTSAWRAFGTGQALTYADAYHKLVDLNAQRVVSGQVVHQICESVYLGLHPAGLASELVVTDPSVVARFCIELLEHKPKMIGPQPRPEVVKNA